MQNCEKCLAPSDQFFDSDLERQFESGKRKLRICRDCRMNELHSSIQSTNVISAALAREKLDMLTLSDGKFFNLEAAPLIELKKTIFGDESLNEIEKLQKWTEVCAERIVAFNEKVREIDQTKFELIQRKAAWANELRIYAENVRKEIRQKIAESDAQYQQVTPKVKPVVKPKKNDLFERMAQMISMEQGIPIETARLRLKQNKDLMG